MEKDTILFMRPVLKEKIWGGNRLSRDFGYDVGENSRIGECWGISAVPGSETCVAEGPFEGKTLAQLWSEDRELFGGLNYEQFPLMVKIIDAAGDLSIQVHPDDSYARRVEGKPFGKTECWYILDCDRTASIIYGHNARTEEELKTMISEGRWDDLLCEIPVKSGDFLQINPGTIHAIKAGTMILETQQSSDLTYRLYDYDRVDKDGNKRELHINKCIDNIRVPAERPRKPSTLSAAADIRNLMGDGRLGESFVLELFACRCYTVFEIRVGGSLRLKQPFPFLNMSVVDGFGEINEHPISKGDHFIVPCDFGNISLTGNLKLVASTVMY